MIGRRGRRRRKLLDDLKDGRRYSHLKKEALDRTTWRNHFGGGFEPVVRQNTDWLNEVMNICAQVYIYPTCLMSLLILCLDSLLKKTPPCQWTCQWTCQWHGSLNVYVVSPAFCHTSQSVNFDDLKGHLWKKIDWLLGYSTTLIKCDVYGISNKDVKWSWMLSICEFREVLLLFHGVKAVFTGETEEHPPKYEKVQQASRGLSKSDTLGIKS